MSDIKDGTESVQLAEFEKGEKTTRGNNLPAIKLYYKRLDGKDAGKALDLTYLVGSLEDASRELLSKLKKGDKFVVVKVKKGDYWNLKEFREANTFVAKPAYTGGFNKKPYEKKEFDQTGIKVGAARNQAIAYLAATQGTKFTLDDVDAVAYEIVERQAAMEHAVRAGTASSRIATTPPPEVDLQNHFGAEDDTGDDIPW